MNGFRKLQERLTAEGWYVGWAELCCQTCAWDNLQRHHDIDLTKALFNHHQDCSDSMETYAPEQQDRSTFCFNGSKEGVENLKAIIPIIEECGCKIHWNGQGHIRPDISWKEREM